VNGCVGRNSTGVECPSNFPLPVSIRAYDGAATAAAKLSQSESANLLLSLFFRSFIGFLILWSQLYRLGRALEGYFAKKNSRMSLQE